MSDRSHQASLREKLADVTRDQLPIKILAHVVPGGGKSRLPAIIAERFPNHRIGWFVPRLALQHQAVIGAMEQGLSLRDSGNVVDPCRGLRGFVTTQQSLANHPELWEHEIRYNKYVVVVDECHHAKISRDGEMSKLASALHGLRPDVWLNMTGTLETNDNDLIYGMHYEQTNDGMAVCSDQSADIVIRYDRKTALTENAIVPIEFHHFDGTVAWVDSSGERDGERLSEVDRCDESAALFTALQTQAAVELFEAGVSHWKQHGRKLIVVTMSQQEAKHYHKRLVSLGVDAMLAITDEENAYENIKKFKGQSPALVTCAMAYEGLDVPDATHLICLTHIRSVPWIEQMLARVWRQTPSNPKTKCFAFVPDDPKMNRVIDRISAEQVACVPLYEARDNGSKSAASGGVVDVLALSGHVDSLRTAMLDGDQTAIQEVRQRICELVSPYGLSVDSPVVVALLQAMSNQKIVIAKETPAEMEVKLRNQIASICRKRDYESRVNFGTTQEALIRRTRKSITEMSYKELVNAFKTLQKI